MSQKTPRTKFWTILAFVNIAAMIYPFSLYVQADSNEAQIFAVITLLCIAFLLAIADKVSALVVYLQ